MFTSNSKDNEVAVVTRAKDYSSSKEKVDDIAPSLLRSGKKDDRGERKHAESEATTGRKHNMHMQESMHKESDNWKEEQHVHMRGRPNVSRVRVLVMYCNG
jgi:hypothetical protein